MNQISVYDAIAQGLRAYGVELVFGLPNDELYMMNAIEDCGIEFLVAKDQRNAVFMATGYALASQKRAFASWEKDLPFPTRSQACWRQTPKLPAVDHFIRHSNALLWKPKSISRSRPNGIRFPTGEMESSLGEQRRDRMGLAKSGIYG